MMNIFKKQNGMNIVGQGGKIILFMLPSLITAIWVHRYLPHIAALPESISFLKPVAYVLLLPGLVLWGTAVVQLMMGFSKGELVTTGAYGVVRNPRCRLACFAYLARFEWLLDTIEAEGYLLRPQYQERKSAGIGLWMSWLTLLSMINLRKVNALPQPTISHPLERP